MMVARVLMLDFVAGDYEFFLVDWIDIFRKGGFRMLAEDVGGTIARTLSFDVATGQGRIRSYGRQDVTF